MVLTSPERADCPQSHGAGSPLVHAITNGGQAGTGRGAMLTALFIQGFPAAPGHPARSACLFRPLFLEAPSGSLGVVGRHLSFRGGGLSPLHQAPAENQQLQALSHVALGHPSHLAQGCGVGFSWIPGAVLPHVNLRSLWFEETARASWQVERTAVTSSP